MSHSSRSALLVEDEPVFSQRMQRLLEEEGWNVGCFPDGAGAAVRLQQEPAPDLVLLDLVPPALGPLLDEAPSGVREALLRRLTETAWLGLVPDWAPGQPHPRMVLAADGYQLTVELDQAQRVVRTLGLKTPLRAWVDLGA